MTKNSLVRDLEVRLDYQFHDDKLLQRALTHRSFGTPNNERLEFLGDSVLGAVIGHYLFDTYPEATEGQLTRIRASLVKGDTLAEVGRELAIGPCLILGSGEAKSGGRERDSLLADAVESLIGGIYLESGFDVCQDVVLRWFASRLTKLEIDKPLKDAKTQLQETLQAQGLPLPTYTILDTQGQAHNQKITISCTVDGVEDPFVATAKSRKQAEKLAAAAAIKMLQERI